MAPETIVDFCRFLREDGFHIGVLEILSAIEVARMTKSEGMAALEHGLRAALCTSKDQWDAFGTLFQSFLAGVPQPKPRRPTPVPATAALLHVNGTGDSSRRELDRDAKTVSGASRYERLIKADLSEVEQEDHAALERIAQKLFKQAASRLSRRLQFTGRRATLDLRRTIHRSVGRGGEIIELRYRGKKPKKPRLVIFLDISGSMNAYSFFLLRFAHALQNQFRQTYIFVFSTDLTEITAQLRSRELKDAMRNLPANPVSWFGGTKIGESLERFNALYARKLLSRDTLFIILSDGWDTGEPGRLVSQLRNIRERVRKIIWLNPLLGLEEYQPVTRGMAAALPYLDLFAPAHSIQSLANLEKHLCSTNF